MMTPTRTQFINAMCLTWRHDYGLVKDETDPLSCGMTPIEQANLWRRMAQVFDNEVAPYVRVKRPKRDKDIQVMLGYSRIGCNNI